MMFVRNPKLSKIQNPKLNDPTPLIYRDFPMYSLNDPTPPKNVTPGRN